MIIDTPSKNNCSTVAAGIINPITGMRLTKTWMAEEIFPFAQSFYQKLEEKSGSKFWIERPIARPANDVEQLNDALSRISDNFLGDFIDYSESNAELDPIVHQKHGYFNIKKGGNLLVNDFLNYTRKHFSSIDAFAEDWIVEKDVSYLNDEINLKQYKTKNIVWCTGNYQAKEGPFHYLPFSVTRGEMIKIKCKDLISKYLYNKNAFILHQQNDEYICGSTFNHDLNYTTTEEGKTMMIEKVKEIIKCDFEVIDHYCGFRPTVLDRKPFLGLHHQLPNTFIFNGLGAKGVTQAPYFAKEFVNFIQKISPLQKDIDIYRYHKKLNLI